MKRYVITGSLGHISKPIVTGLVNAGKEVTVITSKTENVTEIESLGAKALVGSVQDAVFIKDAFRNAEVVYTMIPPIWATNDWRASQNVVAAGYTDAIKANGIKYVVNLSSVGAHLGSGTGPVDAIHDFEQALNAVPGLNVKHLRPVFFYYNLINLIGLVKNAGIIGANYGGNDRKIPLAHTSDIAAAALEELLSLQFSGHSVRNIISDQRTGKEIAAVLGKAIGKEFPWVVFTDQQQLDGLLQGGVPPTHAAGYVAMGNSMESGRMVEEVAGLAPTGKVRLEEFAKEFAAAYNA